MSDYISSTLDGAAGRASLWRSEPSAVPWYADRDWDVHDCDWDDDDPFDDEDLDTEEDWGDEDD